MYRSKEEEVVLTQIGQFEEKRKKKRVMVVETPRLYILVCGLTVNLSSSV